MRGKDRATWALDQRGKAVVLRHGRSTIRVDPIKIWEAQFEDRTKIDGLVVTRPSSDLPQLDFSRFPLDVSLKAQGSLNAGFSLAWATLDSEIDIRDSQIVENRRWFMLDRETLDSTISSLATRSIICPGPITLGQLVWLRANQNGATKVIDATTNADPLLALQQPKATRTLHKTTLFPYQSVGVAFLNRVAKESIGCILADEMGLGKTIQLIGLLTDENKRGATTSLIVCPATILENWRRELEEFAPQLKLFTHIGTDRPGTAKHFHGFDIILTTFETAVRDEPMLANVRWNILIVDEAQYLKTPTAQRTLSIKRLSRRVTVAATGTPVENRLTDLWSIADLVLPGLLGSQRSFESEFDDTKQDAERLAPIVAPLMLRRRVAEVATDLPPRIDIPQPIVMTQRLAVQYDAIRTAVFEEYGNRATLVSLGKLRQFCAHPKLVDIDWSDLAVGMPKYQRLTEILEELFSSNEKALIFCSFTEMIDIMMGDLSRRFPNAHRGFIDGRVDISMRQPIVDNFTRHNGFGFLILNPRAAGVGLNITTANHVIHYTPEWNPAVEDQASARAYRRKQTKPVTIHHLFFASSVEEVMTARLLAKRQLSTGAAVGNQGSADASDIARALATSPLAHGTFE